ncbi:hypothetical protein ACHQM5_026284 [Ranunculus cassubicifolius]
MLPSTGISDLLDDILVDIICRLPIKHIFTCKCVSKLWLKLISNVHMPQITSRPIHALIFGKRVPWTVTSVDDHYPIANTSVMESCFESDGRVLPFRPTPDDFLDCRNGLLLFFDRMSMHYYVCNPVTEQYTDVTYSPRHTIPITGGLIFDPNYKIVHICGDPQILFIFSPEIGVWSGYMIDVDSAKIGSEWSPRYVFIDGSLYRLSVSGYLYKFDVKRTSHHAIELPNVVVREIPIGCIGESQGSLHYGWDDRKARMMLWMLRDERGHTEKWVFKYSICLHYFKQHPVCSNFHNDQQFSVLAFHPTSDEVFVGNYHGIFSYDPGTKRLVTICKLSEDKGIFANQYLVYPFSINLNPLRTRK